MSDKKQEQAENDWNMAPPKRSSWENFQLFLWNSQTKEVLGRTALSWGKILLFYVFLYAFLAAFFASMLLVFFQTLDPYHPTWQNEKGLIGVNPALGFRPMPNDKNIDSNLVRFKHGIRGDWSHWTSSLEKFLKPYDTVSSSGQHFTSCSFDKLPEPNRVCAFDIKLLGVQCTKEERFGYERGRPCIILKLNRIYGWLPDLYNKTDELPKAMPKDLKNHIESVAATNKQELNMVWVSCEGLTSADQEHIGNLTYTPFRGFPAYYFPYKNVPGYLSPIIAVQFAKPEAGVLISVECKVWAKNILHDRQRRLGSVIFELMMD